MKAYVKPVVLGNSELSEGVYAASGASSDCWRITNFEVKQRSEEGFVTFQIDAAHTNPEQHWANMVVCVEFSQADITNKQDSDYNYTADINGKIGTFSRSFGTNNPTENCGFSFSVYCPDYTTLTAKVVYIKCA